MKYIRPLSQTTLINDANLVSYWTLDGNANDSKGTNHGIDIAMEYSGAYGKFGQGGYFNGSSSRITLPVAIASTSSYSISYWFMSTATNSAKTMFENTASYSDPSVEGGDSNWNFYINNTLVGALGATQLNTWYHFVGIWNESTGTGSLYLNGVFISSATTTTSTTLNINVGSRILGGASRFYNGCIDDFCVFNRVLTAAEVSYLYSDETFTNNRPLSDTRFSGDTNLVSYWKLDGNSLDSRGTNNGTDTAITYGNQYGVFGQGCSFNGSSGKINVNDSTSLNFGTTDVTVSLWIKTNSVTASWFLDKSNQSSPYNGLYFGINIYTSGKASFAITDNGGTEWGAANSRWQVISNTSINDGKWHHVVGVRISTGYLIYVDGILDGVRTEVARNSNNTTILKIGSDSNSNYFNGLLDDFSIFNRALSYSEVQELYEREVTRTIYRPLAQTRFVNDDNLLAYWKLDNNSTDSKGGFNGTDTAVTYVDGLFGKVASFNGSTSVISATGMNTQLNSDYTLSCWVKINSAIPSISMLMVSQVASYNDIYTALYVTNSAGVYRILFTRYNGTQNPNLTTTSTLSLGVWYHIVGLKRGTIMEVYLNGILSNSMTDTTTTVPVYNQFLLGAQIIPTGRYFNGLMDDAAVFNRALSREEVHELYQANTRGEYLPVLYKPQGGLYATSLINDASLVSYWKMDGNSRDSRGTNHGTDTVMNYSSAYGRFGQGGYFNGSSSKLSFGDPASLRFGTGEFSLSFWVKVNATITNVSLWNKDPDGTRFYINLTNNVLTFVNLLTSGNLTSPTALIVGEWYNVTITRSVGGVITAYLNGIQIATATGTNKDISAVGTSWTISTANNYFFNGMIDDIALFNRALTAAEVFEIYSKGESSPLRPLEAVPALRQDSNLLGYWRFNGNAADAKGTYNATATNITYGMSINGRFGQVAKFNGTTNSIATPSIPFSSNKVSVSMWVNLSNTDTRILFESSASIGNNDTFSIYWTGSQFQLMVNGGGNYNGYTFGSFSTNTLYHLVAIFDKSLSSQKVFAYINGVFTIGNVAYNADTTTDRTFATNPIYIGSRAGTSLFCTGYIFDVALFNRVLTAAEAYQLYTQGSTKGYWKLNGNSTDHSGKSNHGTDTAITYSQSNGVFNQGALFNGSSSVIKTPQINMTRYTWSMWVKPNGVQTDSACIVSDKYSVSSIQYFIRFVNNTLSIIVGSFDSGTFRVTPQYTLLDNIWQYIVHTYDGSYHRLYIDGNNVASFAWVGKPPTEGLETRIGQRWDSANHFKGSIDDIIAEDRPWSASEIRKHYTDTVGNYLTKKTFGTIKSGLSTYLNPSHLGSYSGTGSAWNDLIGTNNATVSDFTYSTNNGGVFTNSTQRAGAYGISYPLTSFPKLVGSMEIWAKPYSWVASNGLFVNRNDSTENSSDWFWLGVWDTGNVLYFRIGTAGETTVNSWSTVHALNTWGLYTITWSSGGVCKIYFNGVLKATSATLSAIPATNPSTNGRIGLGHNTTNSMWLGEIGIFDIYNRVLTADEVSSNFAANKSRYGL